MGMTLSSKCLAEGRRNALQDYQKSDGIQLFTLSPDNSHLMKSRKLSLSRCAKACSRNRKLNFTCRFV